MSIRWKTLLTVAATLAFSTLILFLIVSTFVRSSYRELEIQSAERDLERLRQAIVVKFEKMAWTTADWGSWDDTYRFAADQNDAYIQSNLQPLTAVDMELNFITFFDEDGSIVHDNSVNIVSEESIQIPPGLIEQLYANGSLMDRRAALTDVYGFLQVGEDIIMAAVAPILTSDDKGPARGTVMMGRYLDRERIEEFGDQIQLDVKIAGKAADGWPEWIEPVASKLEVKTDALDSGFHDLPEEIEVVDSDTLRGTILFPGAKGQPLLVAAVNLPRDIHAQGEQNLFYLLMALVSAGAALTICVLVLLDRVVLKRLSLLSGEILQIGESGDLSRRVKSRGADELGSLGRTFNAVLEKLQFSQGRLAEEHERAEGLLLNILPAPIADRLKSSEDSIAESFDEVTILFADIVGFTELSARLSPSDLVALLNKIFSQFDDLTETYGLEKIKTIGDAYMVAAGLPTRRANHAKAMAKMALDMQNCVKHFQSEQGERLNVRIGINSGVVTAGVIGKKKFIYDLWGEAVNIASRMESNGIAGEIQVTEATYKLLETDFILEKRGSIEIKGRGAMVAYLLKGEKTSI